MTADADRVPSLPVLRRGDPGADGRSPGDAVVTVVRLLLREYARTLLRCALGAAAGFAIATALTTGTLASVSVQTVPERPACVAVQPSDMPDRAGLMVGPDADHLTFLPHRLEPPPGSPWWHRGHDVWLTCWRVP